MAQYDVEIIARVSYHTKVEADNPVAAKDIAREMFEESGIEELEVWDIHVTDVYSEGEERNFQF